MERLNGVFRPTLATCFTCLVLLVHLVLPVEAVYCVGSAGHHAVEWMGWGSHEGCHSPHGDGGSRTSFHSAGEDRGCHDVSLSRSQGLQSERRSFSSSPAVCGYDRGNPPQVLSASAVPIPSHRVNNCDGTILTEHLLL